MTEKQQIEFIKQNYLKLPGKRISDIIGRSDCFVRNVRKKYNLIIPKEIIQKFRKESQFKKGQIPFNKGKKQTEFMSKESIEKSKATRFKKGQLPHNTKYDGNISIRKSHGIPYKYIRIELGKWELLHRHVWEKEKGPIPEGCNVQFKDGDSLNCHIDNLFLINRKNKAQINKAGGRKIPHQFIKTKLLINKINKKVKSYEKQ